MHNSWDERGGTLRRAFLDIAGIPDDANTAPRRARVIGRMAMVNVTGPACEDARPPYTFAIPDDANTGLFPPEAAQYARLL